MTKIANAHHRADPLSHRKWRVHRRKELYSMPPWLGLYRETVELPNGKIIDDYHQLELPDFTVVVARTPAEKTIIIRQYKHGVRHISLTLPGGMVETDEHPVLAAQRELLEETGYTAEGWHHLGSFTSHGNLGAGRGHYYQAINARRKQAPNSGDLEEMEVLLLGKQELMASLWNGNVALLNHALAISLSQLHEE